MKELTTLYDLFLEQVKSIYYTEKQLLKVLPKMVEKTISPVLKEAFNKHIHETGKQVEKLDLIFEKLSMAPLSRYCPAFEGIVEEGNESINAAAGDHALLNISLAAATKKILYYEIASYNCLKTWAKLLGYTEIVSLLQELTQEEERTNVLFSRVIDKINSEAFEESISTI